MKGRCFSGGLSRIIFGIAGQGVQSGLQVLVAVLLVRNSSRSDYGYFSLSLTTMAFWSSGVTAATSALLVPLLNKANEFGKRRLRAGFGSVLLLLNVIGMFALVLFFRAVGASWLTAALCTLLSVGFVTRQHLRTIAYSSGGNCDSLVADAIYAISGIAGVPVMFLSKTEHWVDIGLSILICAQAISTYWLGVRLRATKVPLHWGGVRKYIYEFRSNAGLSVVSAVSGSLFNMAPSFIVAMFWGAQEVAVFAASQILLGPLRIVLTPILPLMRAEYSSYFGAGLFASAVRTLWLAVGAMIGSAGVGAVAIYFSWGWIDSFLYANNYAGQPMFSLVYLALAGLGIQMVRFVVNPFLGALSLFRKQAEAAICGAVIGTLCSVLTAVYYDPRYVLVGSVVGNLVTLAVEARAVYEIIRIGNGPTVANGGSMRGTRGP